MLDPEPGREVQAPPEALDLREAGPAQELLVLLRGDGDEDALEAESLPLDRLLAVAIRPLEPVVEVRHQRIGRCRRAKDLLDEDEGPTRCGVFVHVAEHAGAKLDGDELQGQDSQGERRLDVRVAGAKVEVQQRHSPSAISGANRRRQASSIGGETSTPTYDARSPNFATNGASAPPRLQPRSRTIPPSGTKSLPISKTKPRIVSYWGIERSSMSSKTLVTASSNAHGPVGRCPRDTGRPRSESSRYGGVVMASDAA